jgi:hypothetical protein
MKLSGSIPEAMLLSMLPKVGYLKRICLQICLAFSARINSGLGRLELSNPNLSGKISSLEKLQGFD